MLEGEYFSAFMANPDYFVALFFLTVARILPIVAIVPFFGAKLMPAPARVAFTVCLFTILLPFLVTKTSVPLEWNYLLIAYAAKEALIGFILGFLVTIPFMIVQMSGIVTDNQRGSSSMMGQDATTGSQVSTYGIMYNSLLIVIFYSLDGPFLFLDALLKSYAVIGPDQFPPASFFLNGHSAFWVGIMGIMAKMFALACQLAAPALLTILMADVFLGIINRLAPQVQISFLGQGLKAYFADFSIWLAWFFILEQMGKMSIAWIVDINNFVSGLSGA